jgi:uncharacterized protein (TIGR02646 family)
MTLLHRRNNVPQHKDYRKYKRYLREDLEYGCVYCQIHENEFGGHRNFHVEHFRPKKKFPHLIVEYENLLYACSVCNLYKSDDWPSDNPLEDGKGYIDPCEHDFDEHFVQNNDFEVEALSAIANYMLERLHLNRVQLLKIRRNRYREEEIYQQFIEYYQELLHQIDNQLQNSHLTPDDINLLLEWQKIYHDYLTKRHEEWESRWNPKTDWDDYR